MDKTDSFPKTYDDYLDLYPSLDQSSLKAYEYTRRSVRQMDDVLSSLEFEEWDADCIYRYFTECVVPISFSAWLKRFIYQKAGLTQPFEEVPDSVYQQIIKESFRERYTPFSWHETSKKPGAIIKRWISSTSVHRETVFLLGFGLGLQEGEVSEFLTRGIRETDFNFYNPEEVLLWHCFHTRKSYPEYLQLRSQLITVREKGTYLNRERYWETVAQNPLVYLYDGEKTREYIRFLHDRKPEYEATLKEEFLELCQMVADCSVEHTGDLASQIERTFCAGIPRNEQGNLKRISDSTLKDLFSQQKMSRQRIDAIIRGKQQVTRFDIISLLFFVYSQKRQAPDVRRDAFIREANRRLTECHLSCLLFSNPYEAFVIMCLMCDQPLATYAEVWELSYSKEGEA